METVTLLEKREDLEKQLDSLAQELYASADRGFTPLYPWVFVRQLAKEQQQGSIIIPATEQNKTVEEGIVLAVWRPVDGITYARSSDGKVIREIKNRTSNLTPGQHVLYPHWAGIPVVGFTELKYRLVREEDWSESMQGGIIAEVEYESKLKTKLEKFVHQKLVKADDMTFREATATIVTDLMQEFLLVDRRGHSVTLSGR